MEFTSTYQDLCPWIICIFARTYVLGLYVYLPGPMSLDHKYIVQDLCPWILHLLTRTLDYTSTNQDLCPWIICIFSRTYVLGLYIYLPGPISLEFTYSFQDLCAWIICILTRTDIHEKKRYTNSKTDECTEKKHMGRQLFVDR